MQAEDSAVAAASNGNRDDDAAIPSLMWKQQDETIDSAEAKIALQDEDVPSDYSDLISLHNLTLNDGRVVSFGTAGDPSGTPTLFWYAGGCNRRILLLLQEAAEQCQLRLVCLNRPGRAGTSPANYEPATEQDTVEDEEPKELSIRVVMADDKDEASSSSPKHGVDDKNSKQLLSVSHARIHLDTCLTDAIAVLDALGIDKVGQLFECAGAPFALSFAQHYSHRLLPESPMIGIGSWVQPADCNDTKTLFQFGARKCPVWMIAPLISGSMGSLDKSASWVPATWIGRKFTQSLTPKEQAVFDANWDLEEFVERFRFMQQEGGGTPIADLTVLLSPSSAIGLEYAAITSRIVLVHAMEDKMSPLSAAQWLKEQLPNSRLIQVPDATHEGMLFLLHQEIEQSLKLLVKGEMSVETESDLSSESEHTSLANGDGDEHAEPAKPEILEEASGEDQEELFIKNDTETEEEGIDEDRIEAVVLDGNGAAVDGLNGVELEEIRSGKDQAVAALLVSDQAAAEVEGISNREVEEEGIGIDQTEAVLSSGDLAAADEEDAKSNEAETEEDGIDDDQLEKASSDVDEAAADEEDYAATTSIDGEGDTTPDDTTLTKEA